MSKQGTAKDAQGLLELGQWLEKSGYRFTTVTPGTHRLLNSRPGNEFAKTLRDVFGWSRPFDPTSLPQGLFDLMCTANACQRIPGTSLWQPLLRFSSLEGLLFAHSAFPTDDTDAVFFGPDSSRFVRVLKQHALAATRVVDVGCGSGVGGIALAKRGVGSAPVVLADVNSEALRFARNNAALAGVQAELVHSDVLDGVSGEFDLVIANPPYLRDETHRVYRDGGGKYGELLAHRIVQQALTRLSQMQDGGTLLLYTGAAIIEGEDTFLSGLRAELGRAGVRYLYEELDPDIFPEELERPAYAQVERIAAVFLKVRVEGLEANP